MNAAIIILSITAALAPVGDVTIDPGSNEPIPCLTMQEETFSLEIADGVEFIEFCRAFSRVTGQRVFFDARRVGSKRVQGIGNMKFSLSDANTVFQSVFMIHDIAVVKVGPPELQFVLLDDIKTSQQLKQRTRFIALDDLAAAARRPGEIVSVVLPLETIPVDKAQRALNNIIQEHRAGFVQPIEEANALLITNFAPTVQVMVEVVRSIESAAKTDAAKAWRDRQEKARNRRESNKDG